MKLKLVNLVKKVLSIFFSGQPKFYTIPFGPIKGMKLYTTFKISPRMLFGFDEPWVVKVAKQYLSKGDTVYDVGAHIGYTSLLFAKLVNSSGRVHAFELLPSVANNYLSETIKANKLEEIITIHPIGLSNKQQELSIYVGDTMMGTLDTKGYESANIEHCRTEALDEYLVDCGLEIPKLIKVDVERAEIKFLEGALNIIQKYQPILVIEFHSITLLKEGFELLSQIGYNLSTEEGNVTNDVLANMNSFHGNTIAMPGLTVESDSV